MKDPGLDAAEGRAPYQHSGGRRVFITGAAAMAAAACSPSVRVEPPDRPIEINLNVKIEQEVRIRIDRELDEIFAENQDIF